MKKNQNYADKLRLKTRCVTVDYAGDFHLDVVPRVTLGGKHYVCKPSREQIRGNGRNGYRDWFNEKNRITGGNLKRVVRILKHLRDHKNNYTAKSILLTTLAGNTIKPSDEGTEAVNSVGDTLATVTTRWTTTYSSIPTVPEIKNPVLPSENFNRHWDQRKYSNFRNKVHSHALTARKAKAEPSSENAIKIWQELFGEALAKVLPGGSGSHGGNSRSSASQRGSGVAQGAASGLGVQVATRRNEAQGFG